MGEWGMATIRHKRHKGEGRRLKIQGSRIKIQKREGALGEGRVCWIRLGLGVVWRPFGSFLTQGDMVAGGAVGATVRVICWASGAWGSDGAPWGRFGTGATGADALQVKFGGTA